jgi:hypothetical protein
MNVHPSSGINPPGPTRRDPFASDALYEFKIDTDEDAVADIAYRVRFSPFTGGAQTVFGNSRSQQLAGGKPSDVPVLPGFGKAYRSVKSRRASPWGKLVSGPE